VYILPDLQSRLAIGPFLESRVWPRAATEKLDTGLFRAGGADELCRRLLAVVSAALVSGLHVAKIPQNKKSKRRTNTARTLTHTKQNKTKQNKTKKKKKKKKFVK
jgi:hypothetical protein